MASRVLDRDRGPEGLHPESRHPESRHPQSRPGDKAVDSRTTGRSRGGAFRRRLRLVLPRRRPWRLALLAAAILWLVGIHAVAVLALTHTDLVARVMLRLGIVDAVEFDDRFTQHTAHLMAIDQTALPNSVVFLGDSHVRRLGTEGLAPRTVNLAAGGETSAMLLARLPLFESVNEARAVVFGIGINDLKFRSPQDVRLNIDQILSLMPADVPVIMKAVIPVDEAVQVIYSNDEIIRLNEILAEECAQHANCRFMDPSPALVEDDGNLSDARHIGDGMHLNDTGEAIVREWLAAELSEIGVL